MIVWVHGGGWKDGNKDWRRAVPLVPKGYVIMHGDQDDVVPLAQSLTLADALRRAGVEVTLHAYNGGGHGGRAFTSPES